MPKVTDQVLVVIDWFKSKMNSKVKKYVIQSLQLTSVSEIKIPITLSYQGK